MPRLLIIHHTPSPFMQAMFEAVVAGATDPEIEGVEVVRRAALAVTPTDMLEADGYLLGTPANLGYMSGALKFGSARGRGANSPAVEHKRPFQMWCGRLEERLWRAS